MSSRIHPHLLGTWFPRAMAWMTVLAFIAGIGSAVWLESLTGQPVSRQDFEIVIGFGAFAMVGALLVARRPENWVSWIMLAIGLTVSIFPAAESYAAYVMTTRGQPDALATFGAWANEVYWVPLLVLALVYMPLVFPDGHLPSPRWRSIAWIVAIATLGWVTLGAVREPLTGQDLPYQIDNPIGIPGAPAADEGVVGGVLITGILIGQIGAVAAIVVRFRRSRGAERQQLKWFLGAVALGPLTFLEQINPLLGEVLFTLVLVGIPAAVGIAILRYRLYDIDIIIRRTLQYSLLTGLLALLYFGGVTLLQGMVSAVDGSQSTAATVITTLGIAALFTPLRRRVQNFIDRRFYRQKYDAEQALAQFAATLRNEVDIDVLASVLRNLVDETIQPAYLSLWIKGTKWQER